MVTIKDIATQLSIHPSTVSRALSNDIRINQETKMLVKGVAERMNYMPNSFALSLKNKKSNVIGIMVPAINDNFFSQIIAEVTEGAYDKGYSVMISQSNENPETQKRNMEILIRQRVAGILICPAKGSDEKACADRLNECDIPMVTFDRVPQFGGIFNGEVDKELEAISQLFSLIDKNRL